MSDAHLLTVSFYLLQAAGNLLIAGLLQRLHRSDPRRYPSDWGHSWLALGGYHAFAAWAFYLAPLRPATDPLRTAISALSLVFAALQLAWLVRGTRDMLSGRGTTFELVLLEAGESAAPDAAAATA